MICLNRDGCIKNGIEIGELLILLALYHNTNFENCFKLLVNKGFITQDGNKSQNWRVTNKGVEAINSVIVDSDPEIKSEDALTDLAKRLKEIFPKGKKQGTNYYWADGVTLIIRRLRLFFKKYGSTYSDDQIAEAAEKYVKGFNGNYTYMRLLKYFIFKEKIGVAGDIEGDSELISYIENGNQEDLKDDWVTTLR